MTNNLKLACNHMVDTKALDELEEIIERDAFEVWKTLELDEEGAHREQYKGAQEVLMLIRNFASS